MKAQNRIINEILLFAVGIILTSYIIISFSGIQESISKITLKDDFSLIADYIESAIVKVSNSQNAVIRLTIPSQLSQNTYYIKVEEDNNINKITVYSFENPDIKVVQQLYKIRNKISLSEVFGGAKYIEIVNKNGKIELRRL